ncbi:MAG: tRNA (adenosine(37)-N6)-threonylcarbamoyltransferase complex dimerization subunit type 1 TsaB [Proteobacteria bacterium]|nr:tRNA (adenosine(37)-N6)-threonylcarbamoyltransferase complex dimerization subunit type 1 TsaB [Burkholderiales bacterium]
MIILALDTTADLCSVALLRDDAISERSVDAGQAHSQWLLPMIERLLADEQVALAQIDAIAFGAGPGSFTGLRIACGVAQGMGFALDRPLIPIGSLESVALASAAEKSIVCLDARMGQVYSAAFERGADGVLRTVSAPSVGAPETVPLPRGSGWVGCGNGFSVHARALEARLGAQVTVDACGLTPTVPHARQVALLAAVAYRAGAWLAPHLAAPRYVRDKVALDAFEQAALRRDDAARVAGDAR